MPEEPIVENSISTPKPPPPIENTPGEQNKTVKSRKIIIYVVLIAILVIFLGILAYINLFAGKGQEKEPEATPSATKVEKQEEIEEVGAANETENTQDTKVTKPESYCTDGNVYENKKQGYKVCLIKGWYTSEFDPSSKSVGFDSNPIPEASEYGGLIVVNVSDRTIEQVSITINENLVGETSSAVTIDQVSGTKISGNIPPDSVYYPDYKEVVTIISKFNRTYEVTMITSPDKLAANQAIYNDFLAGWRFLGIAESPP